MPKAVEMQCHTTSFEYNEYVSQPGKIDYIRGVLHYDVFETGPGQSQGHRGLETATIRISPYDYNAYPKFYLLNVRMPAEINCQFYLKRILYVYLSCSLLES